MEFVNAKRNKLDIELMNDNKVYDNDIDNLDLSDENNSISLVISQIDDNSTVLDVGIGTGYVGEFLKVKKDCRVFGIEFSEALINAATVKNCYKDIFKVNLDYINDSREYKKLICSNYKFDYIIFADLLEHLKNPKEILCTLSELLNDNGKILISIPDISNIDVVLNLFDGKFNYNHYGLLDSTHLRFFTRNSFIEWIENINSNLKDYMFCFESIKSNYLESEYTSILRATYPNISNLIDDKELYVFQNIFTLYKFKEEKKLIDIEYTKKNLLENTLKKIESLFMENNELRINISQIKNRNEISNKQLQEIYNSKGWKILSKIYKIKEKFMKLFKTK
ncbi:MAG: class I SAM-dependent methyltransferase [Clostridiales bacterium]